MTHTKSNRQAWSLIAFLSLLLKVILLVGCHHKSAPYTQTCYRLRQVAFAVRLYEEDSRTPINVALENISTSPLSPRNRLERLLERSRKQLGLPESDKVIEEQFLKDAWGMPLNVDYTTNLVLDPVNSRLESLRVSQISVWSSGANRHDDRGLGDDILWPIDTVIKTNAPSTPDRP